MDQIEEDESVQVVESLEMVLGNIETTIKETPIGNSTLHLDYALYYTIDQ